MKIGILSDIHDNIWKLDAALEVLRNVDMILCCGDLCSPFIIPRLAEGFDRDIHIVFGNNDGDLFRISQQAAKYPHVHLHGEFVSLEIGGQSFAMTHFDNIARELAAGQGFDVVCFGHNHCLEVSQEGETLLINPGEIMGGLSQDQVSSLVIYDTETRHAEKVEL